jgi:hypothetical protein
MFVVLARLSGERGESHYWGTPGDGSLITALPVTASHVPFLSLSKICYRKRSGM